MYKFSNPILRSFFNLNNMMESRYTKNVIHIDEINQKLIRDFKILIAGCGIGSYIAECLLRMGFENITIVDGDNVELSNLNRQNYTEEDIGFNKCAALKNRLLDINSNAIINAIPHFITASSLNSFITGHNVAINAIDFGTNIPFLFDKECNRLRTPVIHPYNLGWAAFVTVITAETGKLNSLESDNKIFELNIGRFIVESLKKENIATEWFEQFLLKYQKVSHLSSPPQLSIGVQLLSGIVSHIVYNIATNRFVKKFPEFYYVSLNR